MRLRAVAVHCKAFDPKLVWSATISTGKSFANSTYGAEIHSPRLNVFALWPECAPRFFARKKAAMFLRVRVLRCERAHQ